MESKTLKNRENEEHLKYLRKFDSDLLPVVKFSHNWLIIFDTGSDMESFKK